MTSLGRTVLTFAVFCLLVLAYLFGRGSANSDWRAHAEAEMPILYDGGRYFCSSNITVEEL